MRNSKLIALLSAGAMVLSSLSGLAVSGSSALASSRPELRFSDGYFQSIVTRDAAVAPAAGQQGAADTMGDHGSNTNAAGKVRLFAADGVVKDGTGQDYTGFADSTYGVPLKEEVNDSYDGNGYAEVARKADPTLTKVALLTGGYYNYDEDRTGAIINQEIYAGWQKGYVGDDHITAALEDAFIDESIPDAGNGDEYILLQDKDNADDSAPSYDAVFASISKTAGEAPLPLKPVKEGMFDTTYWNRHGIALYGLADDPTDVDTTKTTHKITLALDAATGHYTKWDGYIYVGDSGADDDGEYLPVHIAYPWAIQGGDKVLYGGEPSNYGLAEVIVNDLPHDQWVWVIADDKTDSFEFTDGSKSFTTVGDETAAVRAKATATKKATCTLKLYNTRVDDDECYVWEKKLAITDPNFYTNIYIRNDLDKDGTFENFANSTFTTNEVKAELRATAEMLINEGATNIPQDAISWTWTRIDGEKDDVILHTVAGPNGDLCTFEVVGGVMPETPITTKYLVRAYDVQENPAQFLNGAQDTVEYMYGSREITVVFDKSFEKKDNVDSLKVGDGFEKDGAVYLVTGTDTVEFAKYVGTENVYTMPSTVTYDNGNVAYTFGVTSVGKQAFAGRTKLKEVTVPASVTAIGNGVFKKCKNLTSVTFLGAITQPAKNVFLKAGKNGGKKLKVSLAAGTSDEAIKALKKSNKNAKIK